MSEFEPKTITRTNSGRVIVYDPTTQTMTTEDASNLKDHEPTILQTAPKVGSRVDVFDDSDTKRLIATLNLSMLGWTANAQRFFGRCNQIWVMELPDRTARPLLVGAT